MSTITHGMFGTPIYAVWNSMKRRCGSPSHPAYINYGARGIRVCPAWQKFEAFFADMGHAPPGMTLERRDNAKGYSKSNCFWATRKEQANNRRSCKLLTHRGETKNVTQWAEALKLPRQLIYDRLRAGWETPRALSQPKRGQP